MKIVKLEETENKRTLHIGSIIVDLNESDYQELVKIFSSKPTPEVKTDELEETLKSILNPYIKTVKSGFGSYQMVDEHKAIECLEKAYQLGNKSNCISEYEILKEASKYESSEGTFAFLECAKWIRSKIFSTNNPNEWISADKELPKAIDEVISNVVLTYNTANHYDVGYYNFILKKWSVNLGSVTHWMPLPQTPETKTNN